MSKRKTAPTSPSFWSLARTWLYSYLPSVRNLSQTTIEAYRLSLENYLEYLDEEMSVNGDMITFEFFEREYLRGWLKWMQDKKQYSPRTIQLRITSMKSFLRYCRSEDIGLGALYEAASELRAPKPETISIEYFEEDELKSILSAYNGQSEKSRRNKALLIILYETAARVSELANIRLADISTDEPPKIYLSGKGSKTRVVPLTKAACEHLKLYLDEFHSGNTFKDKSRPLFYSLHHGMPEPLSVDAIARILKGAADIARLTCTSVPDHVHCHMMRKTRAMMLYKQGVALPLIMQLLGHDSVSTTSTFYAFATTEMMQKAIASAMPAQVNEQSGWLTKDKIEQLYTLR
ncbi:MAG: site-specific integrase [Eggerthellaceae bacterium]|nr:site-specific integrase [Eggerthellaceae bacterium]